MSCKPLKKVLQFRKTRSIILKSTSIISICFFLFLFLGSNQGNGTLYAELQQTSANEQEKGDCAAIGRRRPTWHDRNDYFKSIPKFREIYKRRPFQKNSGGMRFDHSFALWYMLKSLSPVPKFVVESGAHRGHSTWTIRQALPSARIISLSPERPNIRVNNVQYFNEENFTDFGKMDFSAIGVDPKKSVVFFDDHQSAFRRIFREGMGSGFYRFIQEDNLGYQQGDSLSMKWLCEIERRNEWKGFVLDNFAKVKIPQSWEEHMSQAREVRESVRRYIEFPPIVAVPIARPQKYIPREAAPPLISEKNVFEQLVGIENIAEISGYHHICFVETRIV